MDRIHVSVRARPLSPEEVKASPWRISHNSIFIPNQHSTKFDFDRVFADGCKTEDVYSARTKEIVEAAVRGFNGTVFAYGQTSSGKTHTMRGSSSEPGVISLAVSDVFSIAQQDMDREFLLRMSYMEIYNEEINDLLAPEHRRLQIHESVERGIFVAGLREEIVASADHVLQLMEFGESYRHIGETNMNVYSSRSHTIFRMIIESRERTENAGADMSCDAVRVSVLNLVDLAGSERAAKTGAEGTRLKEGSYINKSLMTLGSVIKKLSEGAESQGGHVPYRDSKLTRILQPALGGNANTAIICNITLAQVHADETKSSLQFASRALCVTNCAHVNEILTDAALLKRQKNEIEDLRAKLQGLHSEHLEEEILNLRNTLLTSELERERMALELEEEKKAQAECEKRLQEQEKKIENLSSMVFCANRDENRDTYKKGKRRDTWCPGNLAMDKSKELYSLVGEKPSNVKSGRSGLTMEAVLPFQELFNEIGAASICMQGKESRVNAMENTLPDSRALLHVTTRRKAPPKKRNSLLVYKAFVLSFSLPLRIVVKTDSLLQGTNDLSETRTEYEDLLQKFETYKTLSDTRIDYLTRKLSEVNLLVDEKCIDFNTLDSAISYPDGYTNLRHSDAILVIKQLQNKIATLEMERSSSQKNLDGVVELATEQTVSAHENYRKLYEELLHVQEEATLAREACSSQSDMEESGWLIDLLTEAQKIVQELKNSECFTRPISSVMDDLRHCFSITSNLIHDLKPSTSHTLFQIKSICNGHERIFSFLMNKVRDLESEKLLLSNQVSELQNNMEKLKDQVQNSSDAMMELDEKYQMEMSEFFFLTQNLQKENSSLSSCSLAKEKESIRKDLEKTKLKLKDMESKLKNAVQEKTKLEGEKACAEREVKKLHGQKAVLERDLSKHEYMNARKRDSTIDRCSNLSDERRAKDSTVSVELAIKEECRRLEVFAFDLEATIECLEIQLSTAYEEKDAAISKSESLAADLQGLFDELNLTKSELSSLKDEVSTVKSSLEKSKICEQEMKHSLTQLQKENYELSMQLSDALLTIEEERAIWSSRERALIEFNEEKIKGYSSEIAKLSRNLLEDQIPNSKEKAKLRMRLRGAQSKLDSFRGINENSVKELGCMDKRYQEASDKLKKKIGLLGTELLTAKKELVNAKKELAAYQVQP